MTCKQIKVLRKLNKRDINTADVPVDKESVFCFLDSEDYALLLSGRKDGTEYNFYRISEKGKEFLADRRRENALFLISLVTLIFTLADFFSNYI